MLFGPLWRQVVKGSLALRPVGSGSDEVRQGHANQQQFGRRIADLDRSACLCGKLVREPGARRARFDAALGGAVDDSLAQRRIDQYARPLGTDDHFDRGGAPLGADVTVQCTRRLGCVLQQGYGLTETSPAAIVTSDDPAKIKPGSVGMPIANTECRVVDPETGRDVAPGVDGEISTYRWRIRGDVLTFRVLERTPRATLRLEELTFQRRA